MKYKKIYFAGVETNENGSRFAFLIITNNNANLLSVLSQYKNLTIVHLCTSKKEAEELVNAWNESYKANKTYKFN